MRSPRDGVRAEAAIVCDGSRLGTHCIVRAGAEVKQRMSRRVDPGSFRRHG
jgi:carbonic anhydrase/acetyltransferase-like protein (isoleucine patch superfamily)